MKGWSKLLFLCIVVVAFFLRIISLGSIPPGLTNDEADIGYDAYSILATGHDQWGAFLPVTSFKGFGDYRLPLYTYLVIPAVKIFDLNSFAVRLPSAISGVLSVVLLYFLIKKAFEKHQNMAVPVALAASFFMAITPWSIGLSRFGIESNVAITIFIAALLCFLYAFKYPKLFLASGFLFAVTLFTYTSYTLFTPMSLVVLFLFYKKEVIQNKRMASLGIIVFLILVVPLFIFKSTAGVRASQITFINSQDNVGLLTNLNDRRGSCSETFPSSLCKLTENKQKVFVNNFFKNYLNHFSLNFLFLNGTTTQYSILPPGGLFQMIGILLIISSLLYIIKTKNRFSIVILCLLLLASIPDSLTGDGHYSRASNMIPFVVFLEGLGLIYILNALREKNIILRQALYAVFCIMILYSILTFVLDYFSYFPKYYSVYSQYGYEPWAEKIQSQKNAYDKIYLSRFGNDTKQYMYYLFYTKYDPASFQTKKNVSLSMGTGGWISIERINNLYFVDRIPSEDELKKENGKNILLVTHPSELPNGMNIKPQNIIKDKNGNGIFVFVNAKDLLSYYSKISTQLK